MASGVRPVSLAPAALPRSARGKRRRRPVRLHSGAPEFFLAAAQQFSRGCGIARVAAGVRCPFATSKERNDPMAKDPVCGMEVKESPTALKVEHAGRTYYFCSETCQKSFQKMPDRYINRW